MTDNRTTELLPCPFCGGKAETHEVTFPYHYWDVWCDGECFDHFCEKHTEAEAIAAWNARAERGTLTADDIRGLIERHSDESGGNGRDFHNGAYVAIADELNARAELGSEPPYDELLRCLENDWHINASWDGLRKFWCIELTEEGVWMRDAACGTLTAEQVREAIFHGSVYASYDGAQYYANGINMQAIADELNARAELGSEPPYDELLRCLENDWHIHASWDGLRKFWCIELTEEGVKLRDAAHAERTCHDASVDSSTQFYCSECECTVDIPLLWGEVNYCPNCGRKAVDA